MANVEQNVYSGIMILQSCTWIGLIHSMDWLDWIGSDWVEFWKTFYGLY